MSNLLIGSRRPRQTRPIRTAAWIGLLVLVMLLVAYLIFGRLVDYSHPDGELTDQALGIDPTETANRLHFGNARLGHRGRLAILELTGSVPELGAQHGRLLGPEILEPARSLQSIVDATVEDGRLHDSLLRWRWRLLDDGIPGHQLVEMASLVRGASRSDAELTYDDLVRSSAALDIGRPDPASAGSDLHAITSALTMILPVRGATGDQLVVARSLAMPGLADEGQALARTPVLQLVRPRDALAFASVTWPGMTGVLSGINEKSIAVFVHPVSTVDVRITRQAQPSPLVAREVLENAATLDDAITILKHATSLGSALFVLVDGNQRTWAVVERTPSGIDVRRAPEPAVFVDVLESKAFADDAQNDRARRARADLTRKARAVELTRSAIKTPQEVVDLLRNSTSSSGQALPLGHRSALYDPSAVHTALFDVSTMTLWVSDGPDARGHFHAFDLRHELMGEGQRPAPPPDVPELASELDSPQAVRRARAMLVVARRAARAGQRRLAREAVARALAVAPRLPEALLLGGSLAREAGDDLAARALLQRYLEVGADSEEARQQVEAFLGAM